MKTNVFKGSSNKLKRLKLYHLVVLICFFVLFTFFFTPKDESKPDREYVAKIQRPVEEKEKEMESLLEIYLRQEFLQQKDRLPTEDFYRGLTYDFEIYPFYNNATIKRESAYTQQQQQHTQEHQQQPKQHINININTDNEENEKEIENEQPQQQKEKKHQQHKYSVTIVTQSTVDRLYKLGIMAKKWRAPISAAVFIKDRGTELLLIEKTLDEYPILREFADIHLLFAENTRYPVNNLRNLAIKYAPTDLVFLMDADFVPPLGLHDYIVSYQNYFKINKANYQQYKKYIPNVQFVNSTTFNHPSHTVNMVPEDKNIKVAFVVPSFSSSHSPDLLPDDKSTLLTMVKNGVVSPSNLKVCRKCHSSSNFQLWSQTDKTFEAKYQWIYEPYLIFNKSETEWFDERLKGYGFDKNTHAFVMAVQGYRFMVLPNAFIIHINHPESSWDGPSITDQLWDNLRVVCEMFPEIKEKYHFSKTKRIFDEPLEDECFSNLHW
ncbi:hypothetical protein CYY_003438 [Polysphondylium violaceum]|uniref:Glycosyltransferase n=1 Tax=Polysphondylium violaceum TaxID=133409 RepID=A0A8J4PWV0_9MYCE|nr:hypothetical protein CYY_003438 [Polysphondylium violaceum]